MVEHLRSDLKDETAARRALETQLVGIRARELYEAAVADARGLRVVVLQEPEGSIDRLKPLAQALIALPRTLFVGAVSRPATLLIAASEDSGIDAGRLLRAGIEPSGGRGGGSARVAQGSLSDAAALEAVIATIRRG